MNLIVKWPYLCPVLTHVIARRGLKAYICSLVTREVAVVTTISSRLLSKAKITHTVPKLIKTSFAGGPDY